MPTDRLTPPPAHLIDHEGVSAAAVAWHKATEQHADARRDRHHSEQVELAAAREADKTADVEALEGGKALPKAKANEDKMRAKLKQLARREQAAETVAAKAHVALLGALEQAQPELAKQAAARGEQARLDPAAAVKVLGLALAKRTEADALVTWAADPSRPFKQRTLRVPLARHGTAEPLTPWCRRSPRWPRTGPSHRPPSSRLH